MIPPKRIDIGWSDLASALAAGFAPANRTGLIREAEEALFPGGEGIAVLSVRSGFDLLLSVLALPAGSEILISALTIGDMARIIREHELVPVPVDLDPSTLAVSRHALEAARTPRTRAVVVAHVFGSRMPLEDVSTFTRERDMLLIEDCAQAFDGVRYPGAPGADVSMFSFGPIKTQTCLGGGLLRVRRPSLRASMKERLEEWPVQPRREYALRVIKYAGICLASAPLWYRVLVKATRGQHHERLRGMVRGFTGPNFFAKIRRRPCSALLATMARRLKGDDESIDARKACGDEFARELTVSRPGERASYHTHWVFPIRVPDRDRLIARLRDEGFDATTGTTSVTVVPPPQGHQARAPAQMAAMMEELVFLPIYPEVPAADRNRLLTLLRALTAGLSLAVDIRPGEGQGETVPTREYL